MGERGTMGRTLSRPKVGRGRAHHRVVSSPCLKKLCWWRESRALCLFGSSVHRGAAAVRRNLVLGKSQGYVREKAEGETEVVREKGSSLSVSLSPPLSLSFFSGAAGGLASARKVCSNAAFAAATPSRPLVLCGCLYCRPPSSWRLTVACVNMRR